MKQEPTQMTKNAKKYFD